MALLSSSLAPGSIPRHQVGGRVSVDCSGQGCQCSRRAAGQEAGICQSFPSTQSVVACPSFFAFQAIT